MDTIGHRQFKKKFVRTLVNMIRQISTLHGTNDKCRR